MRNQRYGFSYYTGEQGYVRKTLLSGKSEQTSTRISMDICVYLQSDSLSYFVWLGNETKAFRSFESALEYYNNL